MNGAMALGRQCNNSLTDVVDTNSNSFYFIHYRFYSLWDTGYAKIHIPIIASVSEHQPTPWFSFFFDLHILACVFPAGLWHCIKNVNDERVFIILYAVSAVYFAGVSFKS